MKPVFVQFNKPVSSPDEFNPYQTSLKYYFGDSLGEFQAALTRYESNWYNESSVAPALLQIVSGRKEAILSKLNASKKLNAVLATKNLISASECIAQLSNFLLKIEAELHQDEHHHHTFGWLARLFGIPKPSALFTRHFHTLRRQLVEEEYLLLKVMMDELEGRQGASIPASGSQKRSTARSLSQEQFFSLLKAVHKTKANLNLIKIYRSSDEMPVAYNLPFIKEVRSQYENILVKQWGLTPELCRNADSWFKGRRARAQLVYFKVKLSFRLKGRPTLIAEFEAFQEAYDAVSQVIEALNPLWHRQSRRQMREWQEHIHVKKAELAKELLGSWLMQLQTSRYDQASKLDFLSALPEPIQKAVRRLQNWLTEASGIEEKLFIDVAQVLLDFGNVPKQRQSAVIRHLVSVNVAPSVTSAQQSAYELVYRFNKELAFNIANPNQNDVWSYLSDENQWLADRGKSLTHLEFLLGKVSIANFTREMLQKHWLLDLVPLPVLQRLSGIANNSPALIRPKDKLLLRWSIQEANQGTALASLLKSLLIAAKNKDTAAWLNHIEILYSALKLLTWERRGCSALPRLSSALNEIAGVLKDCITNGNIVQSRYLLACIRILSSHPNIDSKNGDYLRNELFRMQQTSVKSAQFQLTARNDKEFEFKKTDEQRNSPSVQLFIAITDTLNLIAAYPKKTVYQLKNYNVSKPTLLALITQPSTLSQSQQHLLLASILALEAMPILTEKPKRFLHLLVFLLSDNNSEEDKKSAIKHFFDNEDVKVLIAHRVTHSASNDFSESLEANQLTA